MADKGHHRDAVLLQLSESGVRSYLPEPDRGERKRDNIRKRLLIHASAFNLSLVFRSLFNVGTPRGLQGREGSVLSTIRAGLTTLTAFAARVLNWGTPRTILGKDKYFNAKGPALLAV